MSNRGQLSLAIQFEQFIAMCYPYGVIPDQHEQLKDAFIAGAFLVLETMSTPNIGEKRTVEICESWMGEAMARAESQRLKGIKETEGN